MVALNAEIKALFLADAGRTRCDWALQEMRGVPRLRFEHIAFADFVRQFYDMFLWP